MPLIKGENNPWPKSKDQKSKRRNNSLNDGILALTIIFYSFRAAPIQQELPEISGGEGDRPPTLDQTNPVQSSNKNNEAIIQAGPSRQQQQNQQLPNPNGQFVPQTQGQQQQGVGQFIPQQQQNIQPQFVPNEQFQQQQQFNAPGQFPTLSPTNIGQEFQGQNGGQQFQQQIQSGGFVHPLRPLMDSQVNLTGNLLELVQLILPPALFILCLADCHSPLILSPHFPHIHFPLCPRIHSRHFRLTHFRHFHPILSPHSLHTLFLLLVIFLVQLRHQPHFLGMDSNKVLALVQVN